MSDAFAPIASIEVFCSYDHEDESLLKELKTHLSALQRQGRISTWHDREISPGTDWAQSIRNALDDLSVLVANAPRVGLSSIWNVPYPRNSFFTGRDNLLTRLEVETLSTEQGASVLGPLLLRLIGRDKEADALEGIGSPPS